MSRRWRTPVTLMVCCLLALAVHAQQFRPAQRTFSRSQGPTAPPGASLQRMHVASDEKLDVATYNLTPREPLSENLEQVRNMASSIVEVVRTILYAQTGEAAANAAGRRLWFDSNTLQLTITDYPSNLRTVSDYINSVVSATPKQKSQIVFLKHQEAGEVEGLIGRVTGIGAAAGAPGAAGATGNSVIRTLRVEGELTFRDLRIRVTRVEPGSNANLRNDGTVTMTVRTPTTSEDRSIQAFHSEFIEDYEINVMEVRAQGNGEGSARIEVRYNPAATGVTPVGPGGQPMMLMGR